MATISSPSSSRRPSWVSPTKGPPKRARASAMISWSGLSRLVTRNLAIGLRLVTPRHVDSMRSPAIGAAGYAVGDQERPLHTPIMDFTVDFQRAVEIVFL